MKKRVIINYFIATAALAVIVFALYRIYLQPSQAKYLALSLLGCALVLVVQVSTIRRKRNEQ